jgi:succinate dehydrogenase/fumarate reductase cytochrome b subunit
MALMDTPTVRLLELLLVWLVLFHALNGLRLVALSLAPGLNQRGLSYAVVIGSALIVLVSLPLFLK